MIGEDKQLPVNWKKPAGFVLILGIAACFLLLLRAIYYPSTKNLANQYLEAIFDSDLKRATDLTSPNAIYAPFLRERASEDIQQFGGAEIQNVSITVIAPPPPNESKLEFAIIEFEYRHQDQSRWQFSQIGIVTAHDIPGRRYVQGRADKEQ